MNKVFLSVLAVTAIYSLKSAQAQTLPGFQKDYQTALTLSKEKNQVLMIDFYTDWCKPCKKLDKEVYSSQEFYAYTSRLSCVKVDFETTEGEALGKKYGVNSFPTVVFIKPNGEEIERITSYFPKNRYLPELIRIIEGKNTVPVMEARFPANTSYYDLFHLSFYFSRRYYIPEKRDLYFKELKKLDSNLERDSTLLLTNLILQQSLIKGDMSKLVEAKDFVLKYPGPVYQPELALRISKALVTEEKVAEAYTFFKAFSDAVGNKKDKKTRDHLKKLEKMVKK